MIGYIKRILKALTLKPKTVFLIDALGATLTTIFLIAGLKTFNEYFGMPQETLTILSILALVLAIYSFFCFAFIDNNAQKLLRPIIVANFTYCILTLGFVVYFYNKLTIFGLTYFVAEILVICGLVYIELKTLKASRQNISK
jgi:hypothetical protein